MNFAFCKLKRLRTEPYRKLISDKQLFQPIEVNNIDFVPYNVDHKLDDDAWFRISSFSQEESCLQLIKTPISSVDFANLADRKLDDIAWIGSVQGDDVYFQKIGANNRLKRKALYKIGDALEFDQSMDRILINEVPDAVYLKNEDMLLFRNLSAITSIFDGIVSIAREASTDDIAFLLSLPILRLDGDFKQDEISRPNLKRIANVIDRLMEFDEAENEKLSAYLNEYCPDIEVCATTGHRKIRNDIELKKLLYALDERYHVTPITGQRRLANSVVGI